MNFFDINPHVRYVNVSQYLPEMVVGPRKVYDHQFIYVHKGYGWMNIDGVRYSANPGKLFYYGPGVIHTFIAEKAEPFFLSGVHFDFIKNYTDLEFPIGSFNLEYFNPEACTMTPEFSDIEPILHYMDAGKNIRIPQIMLDMLGEFESWKGYCQQYLDGQMKTLLALVARQSMLKSCMSSEKRTCHSGISDLIEYIRRNYSKNITNTKLAEQYHFHPVYLNRVIKAVTGL